MAVGISVMLFGMLTGCGGVNIRWKEEVRMVDGEMLLVDRTAKGRMAGGNGMGGPAGWKEEEMSLKVLKLPANWPPPPIWRMGYVPILLDYQREEHIWSVIATFYFCDSWEQMGGPSLPYVQYQSRNGGPWEIILLEERLIGRKTNLLTGPSSKGEPRLVTAEERDRRNRRADKKYQSIVADWRGCSSGGKTIRWKEEVRMADGEILLLHRTAKENKLDSYYYVGRFPPEKLDAVDMRFT